VTFRSGRGPASRRAQAARRERAAEAGVGTADDIRAAGDLGVSIVRIATHCTEADIAVQHFQIARSLGLETVASS
jgi:4-hydroxy 2-oxovalerate aldolase